MEVGGELHAPAVLPPERNPRNPLSHCRSIAIAICTSAMDHTISGGGGEKITEFQRVRRKF